MDQITQTPVLEQHVENVEAKQSRLSPINRRRWENFKRHKRGYWSLWIFTILFVLSLCAELIANNKPFLVSYDGKWHYPIFQFYPETAFGGDFETEANYRDPEVQRLIKEKNGYMLWPLIPFHYSTINYDVPTPAPSKPTWMYTEAECKATAEKKGVKGCSELDQNWLGTDTAARDVTARMIYGFRISVIFGLTLTILSSIIGIAAGAVQGYFGGWIDLTFQRFIEIWTSIRGPTGASTASPARASGPRASWWTASAPTAAGRSWTPRRRPISSA